MFCSRSVTRIFPCSSRDQARVQKASSIEQILFFSKRFRKTLACLLRLYIMSPLKDHILYLTWKKVKDKSHCSWIKVIDPSLCSTTGSFHSALLLFPCSFYTCSLTLQTPAPIPCVALQATDPSLKPRSKGPCQLAFGELKGTDLSKRGKV